jgi:proline iminopeptidase
MPANDLPAFTMKDSLTWLYPPIEPYDTGKLRVSPVHEIYFEQSGNPSGKPVIFLHGGSRRRLRPHTAPLLPPPGNIAS